MDRVESVKNSSLEEVLTGRAYHGPLPAYESSWDEHSCRKILYNNVTTSTYAPDFLQSVIYLAPYFASRNFSPL